MTPREVLREASLRALAHLLAGFGLRQPYEFINEVVWEECLDWWEAETLIEQTIDLLEA
jgi:hypothetical protein